MVPADYSQRLQELRSLMSVAKLDAYLAASQFNRRYLTGFTPTDDDITESSGLVLVTQQSLNLITATFFLSSQDEIIPSGANVLLIDTVPSYQQIAEVLMRDRAQRVAFEQDWFSFARYQQVRKGTDGAIEWVPSGDLVQQVRARKDEIEITTMRQAADLANRAFAQLVGELHLGMTERQIALQLDSIMLSLGASEPSFKTIVAGGPGGASPHAVPSDHVVQVGEPLLVDFGCRFNGYCSDLTRTICFGAPDPKLAGIYAAVRGAQDAGEQAPRAGMRRGGDIDAAAWQVLKDTGYINKPMHALGHGVGMAVHEMPFVASWPNGDPELEIEHAKYEQIGLNAIITIEPGVYIPGWGGVRLEDMVLVRDNDIEILTDRNPEQLVSIPV